MTDEPTGPPKPPEGGEDADDEEFTPLTKDEQEVLMQVVRLMRKVNYGTVLLVVQDGKVVQIEMAEKIRLR
jgi:hypothetical protein